MGDSKAKLRRYSLVLGMSGVAVGFLLMFAWKWAIDEGTTHRIGWITHLGTWARQIIAAGLLFSPLWAAILLLERVKRKLIGTETILAQRANERRQRSEEKTGISWKVPKSAEAAEWPKVIIFTVVLYVVTFIAVLVLLVLGLSIDWIIRSRRPFLYEDGRQLLSVPFKCANFVGVSIPVMFILMLLFYPRVRVSLISDGVMERLGRMKKLIPYASIRRVCIVPSRRRRALKCVAIFSTDGGVERWHRYDFGKDAPVSDIVKAFEGKGLLVEVSETQGGEEG